ncbi:MAG: hypothetical protein FWE59_03960 [Oscillospiraceae bacterium]|nr:hypothetical protein [Oscillospiraceae bacterium]
MTGVIVLCCIVLLFYFFLRTRVGASVVVTPETTEVRVRFGAFSLGILPAKPKKDTPKRAKKLEKKKKKKEKKKLEKKEKKKEKKGIPEAKKKKSRITPGVVLRLIPEVFRVMARFIQRFEIERLYCHVVIATEDAAKTAVLYGAAHAGLAALTPLTNRARKSDVTVAMDYSLPKPVIYLSTALSIRVGTILAMGLRLLWVFWRQTASRKT